MSGARIVGHHHVARSPFAQVEHHHPLREATLEQPPRDVVRRVETDDEDFGQTLGYWGVASDIEGITIDYGATTVTFTWDAAAGGWLRTQDGEPHVDTDGEQHDNALIIHAGPSAAQRVSNQDVPECLSRRY